MSTNPSLFTPETFLDATTTEESVKRPPMPAGREFSAMIKEVKARSWQGKQDPTKSGIAIDVKLEFDLNAYPDVKTIVGGVEKVLINDSIMLDLTDNGAIDYAPGRNGKLRMYRDATGLNVAGQPFSARMFEGRLVRARIKHKPNPDVPNEFFENIEAVAKI